MKTGFPNPIEPKGKEQKSPWDFTQPDYDERSSCYVNAGSHYGVGHKNPVGHMGSPKNEVPSLPRTPGRAKHKTMKVAEVPHKNLSIEMEQ